MREERGPGGRGRASGPAGRDAPPSVERWVAGALTWLERGWRSSRWRRLAPATADQAYGQWAPSYMATAHNPLMLVEQEAMLTAIGKVTAARVLDLGTGPGRYRRLAREAGAGVVVGVDRCLPMLEAPGNGTSREPGWLVCADACTLPFSAEQFDVVIAGLMVADIGALDTWLSEVARVLRPNGRLIYSDFHETWHRRGWERAFEGADGRRYALPYVTRSTTDHITALAVAGFEHAQAVEVRAPSSMALTGGGGRTGRHGNAAVAIPLCAVYRASRRSSPPDQRVPQRPKR